MTDTATACPDWCQQDHSIEPADHHAGRIILSISTELIVSDTPAGLTLDLIGDPSTIAGNGITLGPGAAACLAGVLADLTT